jgi:uncharacterized membrane protein
MSAPVMAGPRPEGREGRVGRERRELERVVSRVLRAGVAAATVLLALGLVLAFVHGPLRHGDTSMLTEPDPPVPHTPGAVLSALRHGQAEGVLVTGLAVLVLTPLVRVVASVVAYWRARDRAFLALTLTVLALLAMSTAVGAA